MARERGGATVSVGQLFPPPPQTMHRKEHRGLSTGGSTGAASPQVTPESCPAEPDVRPDVQRPRKRCRTPAGGHLPDGAAPCSDPAVGGPKKHCLGLRTALDPDVEKKTAVLKGEPPNDLPDPQKGGDPDAKHLEGPDPALESDRAVKATPKTALFHPNRRWATLEACSRPDVEERGPNPDVGGPQKGCWVLGDSDTDVELENSTSAVEGPRNGHRALVSESDPDVEGGGADPDVGCPPSHRTGRQVPAPQNIEGVSPGADVEGSQKGLQVIVSDSDTDVELNGAEPDVGHPKPHRPTQNEATPPLPEAKAPNAAVGGSQAGGWVLVVDSDTDVEEELSNPDVGCLEGPGAAPREPDVKEPDVKAGTASRRAGEARGALLLESDTDVEEELSDPDVGAPPPRRAAAKPHLEAESPGPPPRGPRDKRQALVTESDTDVEEGEGHPDVGCGKRRRVARSTPRGGVGTTNPDVAAAARERRRNPEVVSDTDVEDDELSQHVPHPKTPPNFWKDPAVVMETPNPDVGGRRHGSAASGGDSDTDVEEGNISLAEAEQVAPTPDVGGLRSRIGFQKPPPPDVGGLLRGSDTDVEETGPFPLQSSSPLSPRPGGDGDAAGGPGDTESVTEEDPNLFLEATQMFLPPADEESPTGGGEAPPQPAPGQDPRGCGQRGWSRRKGRSQSGKRRSTPWLRPLTVQPPPPGPPPPTGTTGHKGASASEATPPLKATPPAHRSRPFTEERTGGRGEATRGRGAPAPPPGGLWLRPPQGALHRGGGLPGDGGGPEDTAGVHGHLHLRLHPPGDRPHPTHRQVPLRGGPRHPHRHS